MDSEYKIEVVRHICKKVLEEDQLLQTNIVLKMIVLSILEVFNG
jgi:hypothetical protein